MKVCANRRERREKRESACVLGPGDRAAVDAQPNLVAELAIGENDS